MEVTYLTQRTGLNTRVRVVHDEFPRDMWDDTDEPVAMVSSGHSLEIHMDRTYLNEYNIAAALHIGRRRDKGEPLTAEAFEYATGSRPFPITDPEDPEYDTWENENPHFYNAAEYMNFILDVGFAELRGGGDVYYLIWSKAEFERYAGSPDAKPSTDYYGHLLDNEVYGFIAEKFVPCPDFPDREDDEQWEEVDACWGFVGEPEYCMECALEDHGHGAGVAGRQGLAA
jgi:hypothetical protein